MASIVVADDHQLIRQGIKALLQAQPDMTIVGEAATGQEALRLVEQYCPDVLILDMVLPDQKGLDVLEKVKQRAPHTRVIILSMYNDEAYVLRALQNDADAYVLKESGAEQLVQAIHEVMAGRHYLSPPLSEYAIKAYLQLARTSLATVDPFDTLSRREREVLQRIAQGRTTQQIAIDLSIGKRTVDTYRANLMHKLCLQTQAELLQYALEHKTLSTEG